jgi:hypothetical protein
MPRLCAIIRCQDDGAARDKCRVLCKNSDIRAVASAADAVFVSTIGLSAAQFFRGDREFHPHSQLIKDGEFHDLSAAPGLLFRTAYCSEGPSPASASSASRLALLARMVNFTGYESSLLHDLSETPCPLSRRIRILH